MIDKNTTVVDQAANDAATDEPTVEQWLAIRKEEGLKIDPETAEVFWDHREMEDPYCVDPDLSEKGDQVGREYFARSPGSDIWVCFRDLPEGTASSLWEKHRSKLAFPAGLETILQRLKGLS
jgi:hypothetical protein